MEIRDRTGFDSFHKKIRKPFYLYFYMLFKLPVAFFCGVRLYGISHQRCYVSIKLNWLTKNPFKSMYFACLTMAAEFSSGLLAMGYCYGKDPQISMLVTHLEATFHKKAVGKIMFRCADGDFLARNIESVLRHGQATRYETTTYGEDEADNMVATIKITWSFKAKTKV
jgi:Domain of unknown function (DUF4442)